MKNPIKALIIVILLLIIGYGGYVAYNNNNQNPKISSFTVLRPDLGNVILVANAKKLSKIEVFGKPDSATSSTPIHLGSMTLVEGDSSGDQTWTLEAPQKKQSLKEIYADGYNEKGEKTGSVSLAYKGSAEITAHVWPAAAEATISGTVKSKGSSSFIMTIAHTSSTTITVKYAPKMSVLDYKGNAISIASIKVGSPVDLTGSYIDEENFSATKIELIQ